MIQIHLLKLSPEEGLKRRRVLCLPCCRVRDHLCASFLQLEIEFAG